MHGKDGKTGEHLTEDRRPAAHNTRLDFLEGDVTDLRREVRALRDLVTRPGQEIPLQKTDPRQVAHKRKPGPREKISDEELFELRDGLVTWLEPIWPDLAPRLYAAKIEQEITAAISGTLANASSAQPQGAALEQADIVLRPFQRRLLENTQSLFEFIHSGRFRRKPSKAIVTTALKTSDPGWQKAAARWPARQIADAMAGVPDIDWRTSLDRCSKLPSSLTVASCNHFARMYNLPANWIQVVPEPGTDPRDPRVIGPFFDRENMKGRADELRAAGRAFRISTGKPDESPPALPIPPGERGEPRNADNENPGQK